MGFLIQESALQKIKCTFISHFMILYPDLNDTVLLDGRQWAGFLSF